MTVVRLIMKALTGVVLANAEATNINTVAAQPLQLSKEIAEGLGQKERYGTVFGFVQVTSSTVRPDGVSAIAAEASRAEETSRAIVFRLPRATSRRQSSTLELVAR